MKSDEREFFRMFTKIQAWCEVLLAHGVNPKITCTDKDIEKQWDEHIAAEEERKRQLAEVEAKLRELTGGTVTD